MRKNSIFSVITLSMFLLAIVSCGKKTNNSNGNNAVLNNLSDSFSFAVGFNYGLQLKDRQITDINYDALAAGMKDAFDVDSGWLITPEMYEDIVARHLEGIEESLSDKNQKESNEFISNKSSEQGINKSESGLLWKVIKAGEGANANMTDTAIIHMRVEFPDGKVFEDTHDIEDPIEIPIAQAWPGMVEALQMMNKGSVYEFYVPYELGFGRRPQLRGMPPNKALIYKIEMFGYK